MSGFSENSWSDGLPIDVLNAIAERFDYVDQIRFRLVCKSWRSNLKPIKHTGNKLPWVVSYNIENCNGWLKQGFQYGKSHKLFYLYDPCQKKKYRLDNSFLSDARIHASKHGWLLLSHPWTWRTSSSFIFYTPFTNEMIQLPKLHNIKNGYDYRDATFSTAPTSSDCLVFVLTIQSKKLCVSTCGPGDKAWRNFLFDGDHRRVNSMAFSKGVFYCLFANVVMGSFKVEQEEWTILPHPSPNTNNEENKLFDHKLIESHDGNLFAVCMRVRMFGNLQQVFRYDEVEMKWLEVENLGDKMLFLGVSSMLLPAVEEASELANTIHRAGQVGNILLDHSSHVGLWSCYHHRLLQKSLLQIPTVYNPINKLYTWNIWIQPLRWT